MSGFSGSAGGGQNAQNAPAQDNTTIVQAMSQIDDLIHRIKNNTARLYRLGDQITGPRPTPVGTTDKLSGGPNNLYSMLDRLREAINDHDAVIDRFFNP